MLCCLPGKQGVLAECRRVIRDEGQMIFSMISIAPDLNDENRARAIEIGPPYVASELPYEVMLQRAGWRVVERRDQTEQFLNCAEIFGDANQDNKVELGALMSAEELQGRLERDADLVEAIGAGLLCRALYRVRAA